MGLADYQLVWHQHGDGLIARAELRPEADRVKQKYRMSTYRFAHVNIERWHTEHRHGKIYADVCWTPVAQTHWCDSIDDAKIWVEALFALEQ